MYYRKASELTFRVAALLSILFVDVSPAAASAITNALEGQWSGSGRLTLSSGKTERIRCHGTARSVTANTVDQDFTCASSGKNFNFSSSMYFSGNRVRGDWRGPSRSGTLSGRATASSVRADLSSASGNGSLTATVSNCKQSLRITGWADELQSLSVQLEKDC